MTHTEYINDALTGSSFTDSVGRLWLIRFDAPAFQRLHAACNEYWGLTGVTAQNRIMAQADMRFDDDERTAQYFVLMAIRPQLEESGVDLADFIESLEGDALEAAISAFQMALEETRNRSARKWNWLYWARSTICSFS